MIEPCLTKLSSGSPSVSWSSSCLAWARSTSPVILTGAGETPRRRLCDKFHPFIAIAGAVWLFCLFVFFLSVFSAVAVSAYTVAPERIETDATWRSADGPFVVSSNLTIEKGARLFVEPGVTIAVSDNSFVSVYGKFVFGGNDSQKIAIDSTFNLLDQFPELGLMAFDGELHIYVRGGLAELTSIDSKIPVHIQSDGGRVIVRDSFLSWDEMTFANRTSAEISDSILQSSDNIMLLGTSSLSVSGSNITGGFATGSLFNVFGGSNVRFENSVISPMFLDFALLLDGSSLSATSTSVSDINSYGIQASRGSKVRLFDTTMNTILSPVTSSAFVMLIGSEADITKSRFSNTESNAIELYQYGGVSSRLSLADSVIEDYGRAGISAVQAEMPVSHSVIRRGAVGIENIFATTTVSDSNISENSRYGIVAYIPAFPVHAENNFWGDPSGPLHQTSNLAGLGNTVSDNVFFSPWLSADPDSSCCSSVLFLPGMEASRLYKTENQKENRLWEPAIGNNLVTRLFMDGTGRSLYADIYTRDIIDEALLPIAGPNIYKSFMAMMDGLKRGRTIADWQPIAYDWRLPPDKIISGGSKIGGNLSYLQATSSPYMMQELKRLAKNSKTGKVTVIAHSYGGLLAKELMMELGKIGLSGLVDKIIFITVPQTGVPQAVGALLHGYNQNIPFLLSADTARKMAANMPSIYDLLPSASYFDSVSDPVIKFMEEKIAISSATALYNFLKSSGLNQLLLAEAEEVHKTLDGWLPPKNAKLIQVAGFGVDTVSGIEYFKGMKKGKPVTLYKPIVVSDGDGTVVVPSALAVSTSTPGASAYWLDLGKYNSKKEKILNSRVLNRNHADIFEVEELRDFLAGIIGAKAVIPKYFSTSTPESAGGRRLHFTLYSAGQTINLYDNQGNHTGISTSTNLIEEQIPETYFRTFGDVAYASVPAVSDETSLFVTNITTEGAGTSGENRNLNPDTNSFSLDVDEVANNIVTSSISFADVPAEEKAVFRLNVPESIQTPFRLEADQDGDGKTDFYILPAGTATEAFGRETKEMDIASITNDKTKEMTKIQTDGQVAPAGLVRGGSQRRRTTLRDIQELIDTIQLPELLSAASSSGTEKTADNKKEIVNSQTAAVFYGGQNAKNISRSIMSAITDILREILSWLYRLLA